MISQSHTGNRVGFTGAAEDGFGVYLLDDSGAPRLLKRYERLSYGPWLSSDGTVAVNASSDRSGTLDSSLEAFDAASGDLIAELWDGEGASVDPGAFSPLPGDGRMLVSSSRTGFDRPAIWNARTGERIDLPVDEVPGTLLPSCWSPDAKAILLTGLYQAEYQLYRYDLEAERLVRLDHPPGVVSNTYFSGTGEILTVWEDPSTPSRLIALDAQTGRQKRVVLSADESPPGRSWRSIAFPTGDDTSIQAWLAVPEGEPPFPTVLHTHGGPTSVMVAQFAPSAQAWLDHGFAFLSVNYRGSTTFGKEFEKAIWGHLGDLEVQDMAAAVEWMKEKGIARPDAVFLTGASYGGYLTLQALGKRPDLWAGGVASVAVADWKLMYEDQADTLRGYQRALFGGTPDETPEATRASSPITYAEDIGAPILVIQGANDTRCPVRQMKVYEATLRELGKEIEIHWFDAGHGSREKTQQIEHQEMSLRFAYRVLDALSA